MNGRAWRAKERRPRAYMHDCACLIGEGWRFTMVEDCPVHG